MTSSAKPPGPNEIRARAEQRERESRIEVGGHDESIRLIHELRVHQIELEMQNEALAQARVEAEESAARYAALYDHAPVGYVTIDAAGIIVRANHAAHTLLDIAPQQIGTLQFAALLINDSLPDFMLFMDGVRHYPGEAIHSLEVGLRPVNGRPGCTAILEGRGDLGSGGCNLALIDITERKRDQNALSRAKDLAVRATEAKSRFLSAASHDLRQPLQTLALISGVLRQMYQDPKTLEMVANVDSSLATMVTMLNSLLDINQIDAGIVVAKRGAVPLFALLKHLKREFAADAAASNNIWRVVPCTLRVDTDPRLLDQILRNLLSNAFKYSRNGKVLMGCRRYGEMVRIEVWDNGIGIPQSQLQAIFEEFYQVDTSARHRTRGLGLGLAIARRQAALLGHHIRVRSSLGRGSVFSIDLPLASAGETLAILSVGAEGPSESVRGKRVLIVEDDATLSAMLERLFTAADAEVTSVGNGAAALEAVSQGIDLLVVEHSIDATMNGPDIVAALRVKAAESLPAIILTGDISLETQRNLATLPKCLPLTKPTTGADLIRAAERLLTLVRVHHPANTDATDSPTISVIDDDAPLLGALSTWLQGEGWATETFSSAEEFLESSPSDAGGCLLIDAVMPGMSGLELLRDLRFRGDERPAIVMTGHGDMAMVVEAMKAGAVDFIVKPVESAEVRRAIDRALALSQEAGKTRLERGEPTKSIAGLTPRERQVLDLLFTGLSNKVIAYQLNVSQRTVENHRSSIMRKAGLKSLIDVYKLLFENNR
ncbi:response regulator [Magnetospirillum fulvum]|uniref:histidine kinase n=1 Tax=Magnetospirillum fulvum TaxID=1082 RepID=A0A1H6IB95_MAGFU|nr:response regulator [Magnetospirillum fulvum]SEH44142.1 PAS domain S-box-containing protein [Magnetospirillum fulvum]